jgi:Spy/CpxP family protein refolding chaperone
MRKISLAGIILLFSASFLLAPLMFGQMGRENFNRGNRHEMMINKLQLTDKQQEAIEKLRLVHQNTMIDLKADIQKKKLDLEALKREGNYSREEFIAKVQTFSDAKQKIASSRAYHRMDIYELLDDNQKKIFDKMPDRMGVRKNFHGTRCLRNF